jgi:hypothetical protein
MPTNRMDRKQFFAKLAPLDDERLRKVLWNLYWRGSAAFQQRIEAAIDPQGTQASARPAQPPADPDWVLTEVSDFVALARSGAYLGGDRRVSPRERTRWRLTFHRLAVDAERALGADDVEDGAAAMEQLIELACELREYDFFRSEDPVAAARFVVSDAAALLWSRFRDRLGFPGFADRAAVQLIRWESPYGWTRFGEGGVDDKEVSLASMIAGMLATPDKWIAFANRYLDALDQIAENSPSGTKRPGRSQHAVRRERTAALARWHRLLLDKLLDSDAEDRLDRLAGHPALGGPELQFFQAQLAHRRGDTSNAHRLMYQALEELPGHGGFLDFATAVGAPLPVRAEQVLQERRRWSMAGSTVGSSS